MTQAQCIVCHSHCCNHAEPLRWPDAATVVRAMRTCDDETVPYIRNLATSIDVPVARVRAIIRSLCDLRMATFGPLFNTDTGAPMGSSYWLTEQGIVQFQTLRAQQ